MFITAFSMKISSIKELRFTHARFFKELESFILSEELEVLSYFERRGDFIIGYVDPADLSFHNFENILDIQSKSSHMKFTPLRRVGSGNIFKTKLDTNSVKALLKYDQYNLYIEPQNNDSRGGKRFIFADNELTKCISRYLNLSSVDYIAERNLLVGNVVSARDRKENKKQAIAIDKIIDDMKAVDPIREQFKNFLRCNSVFRYNRFDVGDDDFKSHYDTPYVDRKNNELSKYTILIYLTRCHNENGLLRFDDVIIKDIYPGDVYIFEQQLLHSGSAPEYNILEDENSKIFIRSELIFNELSDYEYDENVASLFNKACYFSRESMQMCESNIEIKRYSSHLFNSTMKARMRLFNCNEDTDRLYLCKYIEGDNYIKFIIDGNHCYFCSRDSNKRDFLPVFASIVIKNYFFRKCTAKRIYLDDTSDEGIFKFLDNLLMDDEFKIPHEFKQESKLDVIEFNDEVGDNATEQYKSNCNFGRKYCYGMVYVTNLCDAVNIERQVLNQEIQQFNVTTKHSYPEKICVDCKNMVIIGNKIICPGVMFPENINFASCQCDQQEIKSKVYVEDENIEAFVVPPVTFKEISYSTGSITCVGYRLTLDIFQNGFIYSKKIKIEQPFTKLHDEYRPELKMYDFDSKNHIVDDEENLKDDKTRESETKEYIFDDDNLSDF